MTTRAAAKATVNGIQSIKRRGNSEVKSLQELHAEITEA
jgi:carbamoyl-phosphate synthase large subunit